MPIDGSMGSAMTMTASSEMLERQRQRMEENARLHVESFLTSHKAHQDQLLVVEEMRCKLVVLQHRNAIDDAAAWLQQAKEGRKTTRNGGSGGASEEKIKQMSYQLSHHSVQLSKGEIDTYTLEDTRSSSSLSKASLS